MEINQSKIEQAIIDKMVNDLACDGDVIDRIEQAVKEVATEHIKKVVDQEVAHLVKNKIDCLVFAKTNQYGERKGEPLTTRELVAEIINAHLDSGVDYNGKPTQDHYSRKSTRLEYLVREAIGKKTDDAVNVAFGQMKDQLAGIMADTVKTSLDRVLVALKG